MKRDRIYVGVCFELLICYFNYAGQDFKENELGEL